MMLKERASGMYRLSAFYLARTASDIPSDLSIPSLFIAIICEPTCMLESGVDQPAGGWAGWARVGRNRPVHPDHRHHP